MKTGNDVLERARENIGDPYVFGCFVPKDYPNWHDCFDCAEALSYWYYQVAKILYGTNQHKNPRTADAWTGFWLIDAKRFGKFISVSQAARTPGAAVLRIGAGIGHIVLSDGLGGTMEAHSTAKGVIASTLSNRRWTHGILVPGVAYEEGHIIPVQRPVVYRLVSPYMTGDTVREIQNRLIALGYELGKADGIFGPKTYNAVRQFQVAHVLMSDGEVGPVTLAALREL